MTNGGIHSNGNKNMFDRKNYNKFVAQAAKNAVRKKILEIRRGGAQAADELIDQLLVKDDKRISRSKNTQSGDLAELLSRILSKHRGKWRNFIVEAAARFDADALACFGVDLIYGGLMTSSYGGTACASHMILGEKFPVEQVPGSFSNKGGVTESGRSREISNLMTKSRTQGNMVWIVSGREVFSPQMLKIYRYEPEIAFILMGNTDKNGVFDAFSELSKLKNVMTVLNERDTELISKWSKSGMLYAISGAMSNATTGNICKFSVAQEFNGVPEELENFINNPSFPIRADGILQFFGAIESILSGGAKNCIPEYKV